MPRYRRSFVMRWKPRIGRSCGRAMTATGDHCQGIVACRLSCASIAQSPCTRFLQGAIARRQSSSFGCPQSVDRLPSKIARGADVGKRSVTLGGGSVVAARLSDESHGGEAIAGVRSCDGVAAQRLHDERSRSPDAPPAPSTQTAASTGGVASHAAQLPVGGDLQHLRVVELLLQVPWVNHAS